MDVNIENKNKISTIMINRPEARNAVDRKTADQLVEAFLAFDKDDSLSVAVLYGAGGHFCAGADLKAVAQGLAGAANRLNADMSQAAPMGRATPR